MQRKPLMDADDEYQRLEFGINFLLERRQFSFSWAPGWWHPYELAASPRVGWREADAAAPPPLVGSTRDSSSRGDPRCNRRAPRPPFQAQRRAFSIPRADAAQCERLGR